MSDTLDQASRQGSLASPVGLTLVESARLLGGYRWVELRLFEVLGRLGDQ